VLGIQPAWLLKWSESTTNAIVATLPADRNAQVAKIAILGKLGA